MPASAARALRQLTAWALLAGAALLCAAPASMASDAPAVSNATSAPSHIAPFLPAAVPLGQGRFRYFGFHVYDAQLWVSAAGFDPAHPDATPFALDIDYARHFTSREIAKTTVDEFERMQYGMPNGRAEMMERLEKLIPDVDPGQHLTAVFLPGQGLIMFSNGMKYAEDHDPAFAHAFFAIWLDERTKAPSLRRELLGSSSARQ